MPWNLRVGDIYADAQILKNAEKRQNEFAEKIRNCCRNRAEI
ncbi:MAG: hypothetical protein V8T31_00575 [Lachnospiraceae bacterium]